MLLCRRVYVGELRSSAENRAASTFTSGGTWTRSQRWERRAVATSAVVDKAHRPKLKPYHYCFLSKCGEKQVSWTGSGTGLGPDLSSVSKSLVPVPLLVWLMRKARSDSKTFLPVVSETRSVKPPLKPLLFSPRWILLSVSLLFPDRHFLTVKDTQCNLSLLEGHVSDDCRVWGFGRRAAHSVSWV